MYPWCLAAVADSKETLDDRAEVAAKFVNANHCCLDEGLSLPLQSEVSEASGILPDGPMFDVIDLLTVHKPCNIEIEDNFARHSSCAKSARGSLVRC